MSTEPRRDNARRADISSLVWGLIFSLVAALGIWRGLGHGVDWRMVTHLAPLALMAVGALGLLLNRTRH